MKKVYIIKFEHGFLYCPEIPWPHMGELVPTPAQARIFDMHVRVQEALDTYERYFGKGIILEGNSVGHIVHTINMAEGNYVTCQSVSKLYGRD